jgi:hypothetical protein
MVMAAVAAVARKAAPLAVTTVVPAPARYGIF